MAVNWKNGNDLTIFWHDVIFRFFDVVLFLLSGLVTGPRSCQYHHWFWSSINFGNSGVLTNIYQHLQKDEKHKGLEYERFDQVIENFLLSGTIFTKPDPDSFFISNDDIIIESFSDISLLRQDVNEKESKIRDLNHGLVILSEVCELKSNY